MKKGLLREIDPDIEQSAENRFVSKIWSDETQKNINGKAYRSAILSAYLSMFHIAKAVLSRDGYREKSHYCISRYLYEFYVKTKRLEPRWIRLLDEYRNFRHNDQYNIEFVNRQQAETAKTDARLFVERITKLIETTT